MRDLAAATEAFQFMDERLPLSGIAEFRQAWKLTAGFDPFEPNSLIEVGVDPMAPAVIFYDRGYWVFALEVDDAEKTRRVIKEIGISGGGNSSEDSAEDEIVGKKAADDARFAVKLVGGDTMSLRKGSGAGEQVSWVGVDKKRLLAALRVEKLPVNADDTGLAKTWLSTSKRPRFVDDGANQKLLRDLTPQGAVVGVVRPAAWMADIKAHGHANTLLKRLLSQIGPVGVAANSMSLEQGVRLRLIAPGNPRAPAMITSLGQAEGPLVAPDGLIEPGVLAAARLSAEPRKLYELFVSLLPAEQRDEIAAFWQDLDRELSINALRDVLDNLEGHAVLVAYGLDPDALRPDTDSAGRPWFLRAMKLETTREAVLLPIKEREPLELVLDALTTVSKGKLSRQVAGLTIQYAWLVDGELKWAVILGDEHLIFVDSAVAFEHARAYERGARPMGAEFEKIGISRLFSAETTAGLYLDTASLGGILSEKNSEGRLDESVAWLNALSSVVITTQEKGAASDSITDIYLKIAPRPRALDSMEAFEEAEILDAPEQPDEGEAVP